jgi:hypothetical protein
MRAPSGSLADRARTAGAATVTRGLSFEEIRRRHRVTEEMLRESEQQGVLEERDGVWSLTAEAEATYGWAFAAMAPEEAQT